MSTSTAWTAWRRRTRRSSPITSTPDAIAFVEWPERAQGALPSATLSVRIEHLGGDARRIVLEHGVDG